MIKTARRLSTMMLVTTAGLLAVTGSPAWAKGYESVTGMFGEPCNTNPCGDGQFDEPTSIAVNDESGDVYVLDSGDDRVEYFTAAGVYLGQFNGSATPAASFLAPTELAVDNNPLSQSHGEVYVADSGHEVIDEFSETGKYEKQLTGGKCEEASETPPCSGATIPFSGLLDAATDPSGDVWVYEASQSQVYEFNDTSVRIEEHATQQSSEVPGFAVDSHGNVYATSGPEAGRVYEFEAGSGNKLKEKAASALARLATVAINNDLVVDEGATIELFSYLKSEVSGGGFPLPVSEFPSEGLSESSGVAVNGAKGEGTIYATQRVADDVDIMSVGPPEAPTVISESAASTSGSEGKFSAVIDPGNSETTYSFEYSRAATVNGEGELELEAPIQVVPGGIAPAEFGEVEVAGAEEVILFPQERSVYFRISAENSIGSVTGKVQPYTKLPIIADEKVSERTSTSAKLEATVNPDFKKTTYAFEYAGGEKELEHGEGTIVPNSGGTLEEEDEPKEVSAEVFGLESGHTYYFRVTTENQITKYPSNANKGEPVRGTTAPFMPYAPPSVITGSASEVTQTTAVLSGEVNTEEVESSFHFAYIEEAGYLKAESGDAEERANPYLGGGVTASSELPESTQLEQVGPVQAAGLLPGRAYVYALVSVNKFGAQRIGSPRKLTTLSATPPGVITGTATNVSQTEATVSGTIATNGLVTSYGFEISTEAGKYGPPTGLGSTASAVPEPVAVTIKGLQPGTTYSFRATATNAAGSAQGEVLMFSTPGFPVLIAALVAQALLPPIPKFTILEEEAAKRPPTTLEKLRKALKACKKSKSKSRRQRCEKAAKRKYKGAVRKLTGKK